jgi:hypothetical protein
LSSKWDFQDVRSTAITALHPLASPVDKIVLCRSYGFSHWISEAYTELLRRECDMNEEEVDRLTSKDIVPIAKGRREARAASVKSQAEIDAIAKDLAGAHVSPVYPPAYPRMDSIPPSGELVVGQFSARPPVQRDSPPCAATNLFSNLFSNLSANTRPSPSPSSTARPQASAAPFGAAGRSNPHTPSAFGTFSSGPLGIFSASFLPDGSARKEEAIIQINSFFDQLKDDTSRRVVRKSLLSYLQSDVSRVHIALDMIQKQGWMAFDQQTQRLVVTAIRDCQGEKIVSSESPPPSYQIDIDQWSRELIVLNKRSPGLGMVGHSPMITAATLRLVQNWDTLREIDLGKIANLTQDDEWRTFVRKIKYVAHLCGRPKEHACTIASDSVFSKLWEHMSVLIRDSPWPEKRRTAQILKSLLEEVYPLIRITNTFWAHEFDTFYITVEDTREEALEKRKSDTASALEVR